MLNLLQRLERTIDHHSLIFSNLKDLQQLQHWENETNKTHLEQVKRQE
jgi:hypothetical protein